MKINNLKQLIRSEEGIVLYTSVLVLSFVFFIAFGLSFVILREIVITGQTKDSSIAFSAAESGVENILFDINIKNGSKCAVQVRSVNPQGSSIQSCMEGGTNDFANCPVNYAKYSVICYDISDDNTFKNAPKWCIPKGMYNESGDVPYTHCIRSIGEYGNSTRALQILYQPDTN